MKIGVIGLGSIGMRHASNLMSLGHHVFSHDPNKPSQSEEFVIDQSEALVVASPTEYHLAHIMNTWSRPTFMEKPICNCIPYQDISHIKMVGYNLRFNPCVLKAREWLSRIGRPLWANFTVAQYNNKPAYLRDGVILNWSHEIDLALHLLGPAYVESSSVRIVDGCDDLADIALTHENGCRSTVHLDYITKPEQRYFMIQGDKGRISCSLLSRNLFFTCEGKDDGDWFHGKGSWDTDYIDEIKAFIDRIEGKDTPGCTGEEALKVLEVCLEVRRQAGL